MLDTIVQSDSVEFLRQLPDNYVDLVITSPPYPNNERKYESSGPISANKYVAWFFPNIEQIARVLKPTGSFVLNIADCIVDGQVHSSVDDLKREIKCYLRYLEDFIWVRTNPVPNAPIQSRPLRAYEHCFWFAKSKDYQWFPDNIRTPYNPSTLSRYGRADNRGGTSAYYYSSKGKRENKKYAKGQMGQDWNETDANPPGASPANVIVGSKYSGRSLGHPAVFPEYLPRFFIEAMTKPGDVVLDPFIGSGTTAVACLKLNRRYLGCDSSEIYVDIALKRLQESNQIEMVK